MLTYLEIGNTSKRFVWNIIANCWQAKASSLVLFSPDNISATWFDCFTQILVRQQFLLSWFSMNALSSSPCVCSDLVLDSMNEISTSISLLLP